LQKGVQSLPAAAAMYLSSLSEMTPRSGTRLYDTAEPVSAADSIGQPLHHRWAAQCATGEAVFLDDIPPATSEILFLTTPTWPVALPCWGWGSEPPKSWLGPPNLAILLTHCGQVILGKISKFDATRFQFRFHWGSDPDPTWGAYSAPTDPLAVFKGVYF